MKAEDISKHQQAIWNLFEVWVKRSGETEWYAWSSGLHTEEMAETEIVRAKALFPKHEWALAKITQVRTFLHRDYAPLGRL